MKKSKGSEKSKKKGSLKGFVQTNPDLPVPVLPSERKQWKAPPTDKERNQIYTYALYGTTDPDIATVMEMSEHSLRKYFREELDKGRIDAKARIGQRLYQFAVGDNEKDPNIRNPRKPNLTALIFLAKTRCGYKEVSVQENINITDAVQIYLPDNRRGDCELEITIDGD